MRFTILLTAKGGAVEMILDCESWEQEAELGPVIDELRVVVEEFMAHRETELAGHLT